MGLAEKVCVVTGSTGGIGLCVAQQLHADGALVVTSGRRPDGIGDLHVTGDLTELGAPERLIAQTVERFGRVDVLVNNLGGTAVRKLEELTDADWQASFELNLMTAVRATRAVLPVMEEQGGGAIVNVSSTSAKRPSANLPEYSVMKAGLLSFSRLVADRYAAHGIRCNAVTPGPTGNRGVARRGRPRRPAGRARGRACPRGRRPAARSSRRARGDRGRHRVPVLGARVVCHRRRLERRRRHRSDHPLSPAARLP